MPRLTVDGVWGAKTEAAFCEVVGSWATGDSIVTRDVEVAMKSLKAGAMYSLQVYLNHVHSTWRYVYTGGVAPSGQPAVIEVNMLGTDSQFGWRTFRAMINYAAYNLDVQRSVHLGPEMTLLGITLTDKKLLMDMSTLQEWLNASLDRTPMKYGSYGGGESGENPLPARTLVPIERGAGFSEARPPHAPGGLSRLFGEGVAGGLKRQRVRGVIC